MDQRAGCKRKQKIRRETLHTETPIVADRRQMTTKTRDLCNSAVELTGELLWQRRAGSMLPGESL